MHNVGVIHGDINLVLNTRSDKKSLAIKAIDSESDELTLDGIKHFYIDVEREEWKVETLCDLHENLTTTQAIIYCNTRRKVDWLCKVMKNQGFTVTSMLQEFITGSARILITTDIIARDIDVRHVDVVVNYDLPIKHENYIYRSGRSGRFDRKRITINFITDRVHMKEIIEDHCNIVVEEMPLDIFVDLDLQ